MGSCFIVMGRQNEDLGVRPALRDALRLHQLYRNRVLEELRAEIAKGWDGPTSSRSVKDIIRDKTAGA